MTNEFKVVDFQGFEWHLFGAFFKEGRSGAWTVWMWVKKGPKHLTTPPYQYQQIPLPVFTDWWPSK